MEKEGLGAEATRIIRTARFLPQRGPILDSVLTETALSELKRQAPAGCVLCALDVWDEEEWD